MNRRLQTVLILVSLAWPLASCGAATTPQGGQGADGRVGDGATTTAATGQQPWLTPDGDVLITCGFEPAFPASVVEDGGLTVTPEARAEIVAAMAELKEEGGIDAPGPLRDAEADQVAWMVLWEGVEPDGDEGLGLLLAPPGATGFSLETDEYLALSRWNGPLGASAWGGTCRARPALDASTNWAQIAWAEDAAEADGGTLHLLVSEMECASARDPEPFLAPEPYVVETEQDVTLYWTSEAVVGGANCPTNPWVERTVELASDLGERTLLDGSTWPPRQVEPVADHP